MSLHDSLKRDTVASLEINPPVIFDPADPVCDAVAGMRDHRTGCVLVCESGVLAGIFTERDVLTRVLAANLDMSTPLRDVMSADPDQVSIGENVREVIRRMHQGGFRHVPVINEDGTVAGVASVRRLMEYLVDHFPNSIYTLPPSPKLEPVAREGA